MSSDGWEDVRNGEGHLLCKYQPSTMTIEVVRNKKLERQTVRPFHKAGLPKTSKERMFPVRATAAFTCFCGQTVRLTNRETLECVCGRTFTLLSNVTVREKE